jgi:asparagine synthase (glutamine-hydrolysing)
MCGIAGVYRFGAHGPSAPERDADRLLVATMMQAIEYRGPDDSGLETIGRATFGVRRLSILDVGGGHQPLADASGRVWAMQNGEIYNFPALRAELAARHPLRTHTDTELLPHLWLEGRERGIERLDGMFACAIFDAADDTLLLARDPLGVKPLYLARVGDRLLFASELKALLCDPELPRELDLDAVGSYLALGFIPGEATPFRAVRKVRPGCRVIATPFAMRSERYWQLPRFFAGPEGRSLEACADEAGERLGAATRAMLLSDRPVGLLLSGGLDSSLMTALLPEEVRRETRTFAIGFEGGGHHDERAHARRVAAHLGTRHREFVVALAVAAELERVVRFLDEPCADPAAVPAFLVARAASAEVTVLLSGTGGDEVFGGYRRYRLPALLRRTAAVPRAAARALARLLAEQDLNRSTSAAEQMVMTRKLLEARGRSGFMAAYLSAFEPAPPWRWREALAVPASPESAVADLSAALARELGAPPARGEEAAFAFDHLYYLPDDLLLKEDRTTMGASVEGRVPFLDPALVQIGAGLPLETRFGRSGGKQVLRTLGRRHLPEEIVQRPKHGFSVPIEDWLRGPLAPLARDVFGSPGSGVFRREVLLHWLDEHQARRDRSGPLWAALCFELWWSTIGSARPEALADAGRPLEPVR